MMEGIADEFEETISGPQVTSLSEIYHLPNQQFCVALDGQRVVGTVGLELLSHQNAVLKRMMTDKEYRGPNFGLAAKLLQIAVVWGRSHQVETIFLGTMSQFQAAQRFYTKHGCVEVPKAELPADMPINPIDSLFYRLNCT